MPVYSNLSVKPKKNIEIINHSVSRATVPFIVNNRSILITMNPSSPVMSKNRVLSEAVPIKILREARRLVSTVLYTEQTEDRVLSEAVQCT
jgi:hypothetical protein